MGENVKSKFCRYTYNAMKLREQLRVRAVEIERELGRSVGRLTSYDETACPEYVEVLDDQYRLVNRLLYIQNCRRALESCMAFGFSRMKFRSRCGVVTTAWFKKTSMGRVVTSVDAEHM